MPYPENQQLEEHGDGYAFYNPAPTLAMQTVLDAVRLHAAHLRGG